MRGSHDKLYKTNHTKMRIIKFPMNFNIFLLQSTWKSFMIPPLFTPIKYDEILYIKINSTHVRAKQTENLFF